MIYFNYILHWTPTPPQIWESKEVWEKYSEVRGIETDVVSSGRTREECKRDR